MPVEPRFEIVGGLFWQLPSLALGAIDELRVGPRRGRPVSIVERGGRGGHGRRVSVVVRGQHKVVGVASGGELPLIALAVECTAILARNTGRTKHLLLVGRATEGSMAHVVLVLDRRRREMAWSRAGTDYARWRIAPVGVRLGVR